VSRVTGIGADAGPHPTTRASAAFAALLRRLRGDDDAGVAYERLRSRLIRYFRLHVPAEADELADVAIDRLARRVDEGVEVANVPLYALGIARLVLLEARARYARRQLAESDPTGWPDDEDPDTAESHALDERAATALVACLDEAGEAARSMIVDYYAADGGERIRVRKRLADELGVSINALRNRALRLREALEACMRKRLLRTTPA
jgi:DNA-directed RNA polymerase specialized sigma24 family protein